MNKHLSLSLLASIGLVTAVIIYLTKPSEGKFSLPIVYGLYYETNSGVSGYTQKGNFSYNTGDIVTFYLGTKKQKYRLGSISAKADIALAELSSSPRRTNNLLRVLASFDANPLSLNAIELDINQLSSSSLLIELENVAWDTDLESFSGKPLPTIEAASHYLLIQDNQAAEQYVDVIFSPKDKILRTVWINLRSPYGEACYYDLDRRLEPNYIGPHAALTVKVTDEGIHEYPDLGDHFGSDDRKIHACNLNIAYQRTEHEFTPIKDFRGFQGILRCAKAGCTENDLNGYMIDDRGIEEEKYRSIATSFDTETQLVTQKFKGLGRKKGMRYTNLGEFLTLSALVKDFKAINFEGVWLEREYGVTGDTNSGSKLRCLFFKEGNIFTSPTDKGNCNAPIETYRKVEAERYADMWWYNAKSSKATIVQLNMPVTWRDNRGLSHYTAWEYMPAGRAWDRGVLYRLSQRVYFDKDGKQHEQTIKVTEYTKL